MLFFADKLTLFSQNTNCCHHPQALQALGLIRKWVLTFFVNMYRIFVAKIIKHLGKKIFIPTISAIQITLSTPQVLAYYFWTL